MTVPSKYTSIIRRMDAVQQRRKPHRRYIGSSGISALSRPLPPILPFILRMPALKSSPLAGSY
jgi:hypothetical protein